MPKKPILFFAGCLCSFMSIAQIQKGTVVTHFNIGDLRWLNISKGNTNLSFNPGVGYFIKNNWEVGGVINYNRFYMSESHSPFGIGERGHTKGINAYTNYYFGKGKLKPYLTFKVGFENSQWTTDYSGTTQKYNRNYLVMQAGAGILWQVRPRVGLFAEAGYMNRNSLGNAGYNYGQFYMTMGVRFTLGQKNKH